jgi:CheY-like chemotaxis protein
VLVIEGERKVLCGLEAGLREAGYEVVTATNGETGHELASTPSFDCLVLDLMLPGRDGLSVLADLRREQKSVPVLILTARDALEDRVLAALIPLPALAIGPLATVHIATRGYCPLYKKLSFPVCSLSGARRGDGAAARGGAVAAGGRAAAAPGWAAGCSNRSTAAGTTCPAGPR